MKKIVFSAIFAFAAVIGGHQLYKSKTVNNLSELMKANVEALALDGNEPGQEEKTGTLYGSNLNNFCCCPGTRICGSANCEGCPTGN